ncbi:MAG: hypothetical protein NTX15_06425 [Candidatus Kapabacteria bacterium]|nr:hypothetical protein [Candidatus Kapabacteria bacterium]
MTNITGGPTNGGRSLFDAAEVGAAEIGVSIGEYTITRTVANNIATRPYIQSPSMIRQIMSSGVGVPDAFFEGGVNYVVQGTFNGSKGIYELGINPATKTVYHFLFKTTK